MDFVSANILMDTFIRKNDWNSAIAISWELYIQDYFFENNCNILVFLLTLHACLHHIEYNCFIEKSETCVDEDENVCEEFGLNFF